MKRINFKQLCIVTCLSLMLAACSSGDNQVAGIGGTGITSSGTVTGFGSIFVNGVEFETTGASITVDDNSSASENDLALGMVVTVTGTEDASGTTGLAATVVFDDSIEGPVTGPITSDADGQTKTFTILGQTVVIDKTTTVFEKTSFDLVDDKFNFNDVVEVSGFVDNLDKIAATRLERKSDFSGSAEVELKGTVSKLDKMSREFSIGTQVVKYDGNTIFDDMVEDDLKDDLFVEVKGVFDGAVVLADKIERETEGFGGDLENVSIEGLITNYVSDASFKLQGQTVDASAATFEPGSLVLVNGLKVEVKGSIEGGVLKATKVKSEDGELKFETSIFQIDSNNKIITLSYPAPPSTGGGQQLISVTVNSGTKLEVDGANTFAEALATLNSGDFVKIEAFDNGAGEFVATELKDEDDGDLKLKGPLDEDAQIIGSDGSVKILGVLVKTDSKTKFEDENDLPMTQGDFFAAAKAGVVVKVKDKKQGNKLGDGVADEIELED